MNKQQQLSEKLDNIPMYKIIITYEKLLSRFVTGKLQK